MPDMKALFDRLRDDIVTSPFNMMLVGLIVYFSYRLFIKSDDSAAAGGKNKKSKKNEPQVKRLPRMPKRDFTLDELKPYSGTDESSDGRILIAVLGRVFDMSSSAHFYGPGGPYSVFAGRDASRALATFSVEEQNFKDTYDDLSDLTSSQMASVKEWEMQFLEKYDVVGKLLKPGETHTDYNTIPLSDIKKDDKPETDTANLIQRPISQQKDD